MNSRLPRSLLPLLLAGVSSPAAAWPAKNMQHPIPGYDVLLFEDTENANSPSRYVFYYVRDTAYLKRSEAGRAFWAFTFLPGRRSQVDFSLEVEGKPELVKNREAIRAILAADKGTTAERIVLTGLPVVNSSFRYYANQDLVESQYVPQDGLTNLAELHFSYRFNADGTTWFREDIIGRDFLLGQFSVDVQLFNPMRNEFELMKTGGVLSLSDVPWCAVTVQGCSF